MIFNSTAFKQNQKTTSLDNRCLIIVDLDGTLLNQKAEITKKTYNTVKKIINAGHKFCIFTGRPLRNSKKFHDLLNLDTPIVNYNGAFISNPKNPRFKPLEFSISRNVIIDLLSDKKITNIIDNVLIETQEGSFFLYHPRTKEQLKATLQHFHIVNAQNVKYMDGDPNALRGDVLSILINLSDNDHKHISDLMYYIKLHSSTMLIRSWSEEILGTIIEINSYFATKGMALRFISAYYNIPLERIYTFGDSDNDVDMLSAGVNSYAMRNGTYIAKMAASKITQFTNEQDGVAFELKKIFKKNIN